MLSCRCEQFTHNCDLRDWTISVINITGYVTYVYNIVKKVNLSKFRLILHVVKYNLIFTGLMFLQVSKCEEKVDISVFLGNRAVKWVFFMTNKIVTTPPHPLPYTNWVSKSLTPVSKCTTTPFFQQKKRVLFSNLILLTSNMHILFCLTHLF